MGDQILRPYAVVIGGEVRAGLEIELVDGVIHDVRRHRGLPDMYVLSPAFVNAHSHMEYRAMRGRFDGLAYWPWIRALTLAKGDESAADVLAACRTAAEENVRTGVALVAEHSDRPGSAQAMQETHLQGRIYKELLTLGRDPLTTLANVRAACEAETGFGLACAPSPHAPHTVDEVALRTFAEGAPFSIHVAETTDENEYFLTHQGPIRDLRDRFGLQTPEFEGRVFEYLEHLGLVRPGMQMVHACDLNEPEVYRAVEAGATVAHCPRSNEALGCPPAKVREMLDAGMLVGLGLDSVASSGPIDMFAEMRAAIKVAERRGAHLKAEEVWAMATTLGAASVGESAWEISVGSQAPLIKIHREGIQRFDELIAEGKPEDVEWV